MTVSDWVKVIDEALNPTAAIPITPLQQRAVDLRRDFPEVVQGIAARLRDGSGQLDRANQERKLREYVRRQLCRGLWPIAEAELSANGSKPTKIKIRGRVADMITRMGFPVSERALRRYNKPE